MAEIPPEIEGRGGKGVPGGNVGSSVTESHGVPGFVGATGAFSVKTRPPRVRKMTAREESVGRFIVVPFVNG